MMATMIPTNPMMALAMPAMSPVLSLADVGVGVELVEVVVGVDVEVDVEVNALTKCPSTRWRYGPFLKILRHEFGKEASRDTGSSYGNHVVS